MNITAAYTQLNGLIDQALNGWSKEKKMIDIDQARQIRELGFQIVDQASKNPSKENSEIAGKSAKAILDLWYHTDRIDGFIKRDAQMAFSGFLADTTARTMLENFLQKSAQGESKATMSMIEAFKSRGGK
jgi:hypothetical protein